MQASVFFPGNCMDGWYHHHTDPVHSLPLPVMKMIQAELRLALPDSFMEMKLLFCSHPSSSHFFSEKCSSTHFCSSAKIQHKQLGKALFCTCLTQEFLSVIVNALQNRSMGFLVLFLSSSPGRRWHAFKTPKPQTSPQMQTHPFWKQPLISL